MKHPYIFPTIEIVRLSSDTALLNALGASGDLHETGEGSQSLNRAPKRTEPF